MMFIFPLDKYSNLFKKSSANPEGIGFVASGEGNPAYRLNRCKYDSSLFILPDNDGINIPEETKLFDLL